MKKGAQNTLSGAPITQASLVPRPGQGNLVSPFPILKLLGLPLLDSGAAGGCGFNRFSVAPIPRVPPHQEPDEPPPMCWERRGRRESVTC